MRLRVLLFLFNLFDFNLRLGFLLHNFFAITSIQCERLLLSLMILFFRLLDIVSLLLEKLGRFLTIDLSLHSLLLDASTSFFLLFLLDFLLLLRLSTNLLIVSLAFLLFLVHSSNLFREFVNGRDVVPLLHLLFGFILFLVFAKLLESFFSRRLLFEPLSPSRLIAFVISKKEHAQIANLIFIIALLVKLLLSLSFGLLNLS